MCAATSAGEPNDTVTLTVLYDNYRYVESLQAEWGFSCLIKLPQQTILFDTGGDANVLAANCAKMCVEPNAIDSVFISHMHWDHINGLDWLIKKNEHLKIYLPDSAPAEKVKELREQADEVTLVSETRYIVDCVFSTGTMQQNVPEQSLCIETENGLVVIVGCSHPGIVRILKRTKELSDKQIHFVLGGFHLGGYSTNAVRNIIKKIKTIGVEKIGPTHCTGDAAIAMFKQAWADNYMPAGVGRQFEFTLQKN